MTNTTESSTVHRRKKTSIADLPPELLSIIFKFVHQSRPPIRREKNIIPTWMRMEGPKGFEQSVTALITDPTIPEDPNVKSPTLFPYSLSAVCLSWRDLLCVHSEFWTLVVLFVDSKPTSLVEASLILKWSQQQHIDIFITHRDKLRPVSYSELHERCHVDALLHIVEPHLHRCRSLHVDAHWSSSFPVISERFHCLDAPHLKSMDLLCHALADDEDDVDDINTPFEPDLTRLVIDGLTPKNLQIWAERCSELEQIIIARCRLGEHKEYCLDDLLNSLTIFHSPKQLKLENLHFPVHPNSEDEIFLKIPYVHLEDLCKEFIIDIYCFVVFTSLSVLRITRCPLPRLHNFYPAPKTLILEDIGPNVRLLKAVTAWRGENLWLDRCHSFSGTFLEALGRLSSPGYPCGQMRRLLLYRLPKFSISSLKNMIDNRNEDVRYTHPDWKTLTTFGPAISHLAVVQCGGDELSAEDDEWFRSRLVEFYWTSWFFFTCILVTNQMKSKSLEVWGVLRKEKPSILVIDIN